MFAVLNTLNARKGDAGTILSLHRSPEAADKSAAKLQKAFKRTNNTRARVPLRVDELKLGYRWSKGDIVSDYCVI